MEQPRPRRRKAVVDAIRRKVQAHRKQALRMDGLLRFQVGLGELFDKELRSRLLSRRQLASFSPQKRTHVWGVLRRGAIFHRYCWSPARYYLPSSADSRLLGPFAKAIHRPKIFVRVRENVRAAMTAERLIPGGNLLVAIPKRKTPPPGYSLAFLNSPVLNFFLDTATDRTEPLPARLGRFKVPLLRKAGADAVVARIADILPRAARARDLALRSENVHEIARAAGVELVPLQATEGILREINVPKSLGEIVDVKRRGPVVIFRRGSTIVTTTEESAIYLELWLAERFHEIKNLNKAQLGQHIKMPALTAQVVRVLQHRAKIEDQILKLTSEIDALQDEINRAIYDVYGLTPREREFLGMFYV